MSIRLKKNQSINLEKKFSLTNGILGLGWETNRYTGDYDFDLDVSAFLLNTYGKCKYDADFIFYNNLESRNGAVIHTGDDLTGGDGTKDDEQIKIDFNLLPKEIENIVITITIHEADHRKQNFGHMSNAYVRFEHNGDEKFRFDLSEDFSTEKAIIACAFKKENESWIFTANGEGYSGDLASLCVKYGLTVE